jgi:hypothetical protein
MKLPELERMSPWQRRRFLKCLGQLLAVTSVSPALRFAVADLAGGEAFAQAQATPPTLFLEVNLRDQWDHGHFFVAPGLATFSALRKGESGRRAALYFGGTELQKVAVNGTDVYLTNESKILAPHLDTIAMVDTCELSQGAIHGHEAANPLRSPGRTYDPLPGHMPMFRNDPISNFPQGCEAFYSTTPTPASLHNAYSKSLDPQLKNGLAFKGISRPEHTVYHFAAGLPGAELDRKQSVQSLHEAFPDRVEDLNILATPQHAEAFVRILKKVDAKHLERRRMPATAGVDHSQALTDSQKLLYSGATRVVSLPLTAEETAYWREGVPDQVGSQPKAQIWHQFGLAFKLLSNDMVRSVALEFDYIDQHDTRPESLMRTEAKQAAIPLARIIEKLKAANLYERTLIALYTTDGSRSPAANSSGNEGKNTVILAGGMVRGGYYGDVTVAGDDGDGHRYGFRAPDPTTGAPGPVRTDNSGRLSAAAVYRTVARALRIPDAYVAKFPAVANAQPLPFLLRG